MHLHERQHAGVCNATRGRGRSKLATKVAVDCLFPGQHLLWRCLVELGIIEHVQSILGNPQKLLCSTIRSHKFSVLLILFFPVLSGLCDRLVKRFDAISECLQFLGERGYGLCGVCNRGIQVLQVLLEALDLVLCSVKLSFTILLLVIVIELFLSKDSNKFVNEREHLVKAHLAPREGHSDQVEGGLAGLLHSCSQTLDHGRGLTLLRTPIRDCLQKAWAGQSLLEELQRVIIVQDFDCLRESQELCVASLGGFLPLRL
mmetsp:Transcript_12876/g.29130  ORF Transcript_12876/g.29130 Transcript_12876/m.29130 type:complete len:259 (+) Transcript_12876:562-1338(+)